MKKKYKSLGVNAFLNAVKSGLSIVFPLITYPYAFRILHANGIGKVDYSNSIVSYFILIAALGITSYAVREGAKVRDDKEKIERLVSELFTINLYSTLVAYILLGVCVFVLPTLKDYALLIGILSLSIGFTTLGIEWINTIYEDYLYITVRSIITHLVSLVLLFLLVRNENDYIKYAMLTVITNAVICVMNWWYCRKIVKVKLTRRLNLGKHFKPIMYLFANSVATSIYVSADTTMLGYISGDTAVGLYSAAVKIYNVVKRILVALYSVAIPRISYYLGQGDIKQVRQTYSKLISNLIIILFPASTGLICVAEYVVYFMGGSEYYKSAVTLQILCIALIGAICGGAVTYCLNIPLGKEKNNVYATVLSAIINVGLNLVLIPRYAQNGAAFTTAVSELFVPVFAIAINREFKNYIDIKMISKNTLQSICGCVSIVIISVIIHGLDIGNLMSLVITMVVSGMTYLLLLILFKNEIALSIIYKAISKIRRK
ncbi:flippase [Pseudobutyrivibrio sp.]|uniref:flippase n=1 Tax=Pseudobutyrivibrio sp. TaxID=2014367 RepID=UPI001B55B175|nr:flippase [Pseudobutyrivibrio sp.]MBP3263084.1 flippase [Pseudobutyrivibrio sp.]